MAPHRRLGPASCLPFVLALAGLCSAQVNEWISDASGSWFEGARWSLGRPPIEGEAVLIDRGAFDPVVSIECCDTAHAGAIALHERLSLLGGSLVLREMTIEAAAAVDGFGTLAGNFVNLGLLDLYGQATIVGAVDIRDSGAMRIRNQSVLVTGLVSSDGAIHVLNADVSLEGGLATDGLLNVDVGTLTTTALTVGADGAITARKPECELILTGDFDIRSRQASAWQTPEATLRFNGGDGAVHTFEAAATDRGPCPSGYEDNFAWGAFLVGPSEVRVELEDLRTNGQLGRSEAVYVDRLILFAGSTLDLNGLQLYYRSEFTNHGGRVVGGMPMQVVGPPENDACASAASIDEGAWPFDISCGTTDGPGDCPAEQDVWFSYTASCTGESLLSLCSSSYDTMMAVYASGCPAAGLIACADDECLDRSQVTLPVLADTPYLVRVGGAGGESGGGILDIMCTGQCAGGEHLKLRCRQRRGRNVLAAKALGGVAGDTIAITLTSGQSQRGRLDDRGKARFKFTGLSDGAGEATAVWGCGFEAQERFECPSSDQTFRLTTGTDVFFGGGGNDLFDASLEFDGGYFMTLGNSDDLDGGDGMDTLVAQFKAGVTVSPSGLTGIEHINAEITDTNSSTLSLANSNAVTSVTNNSSGAALTFSNGQTVIADFAVTNTGNNTTVTISKTNALNGTTDEGTLTLSSVTGGTFTAQPSAAGSGYETFNLVSSGGIANTLGTFSQGNGNSLTAMNFSGDQNLTITNALPSTVTTANASTMTGALSVVLPATNIAVTGGSGEDTVNDAGNYSTSDTLNGGDGTGDKLILNSAEAAVSGNQSNVSNFEVLQIANALANDLTISRLGATQINLVAGTGSAVTLTIPVGGTLEVSNASTSHNLMLRTPSESDTTADTLNMNVKGVNIGGSLLALTWETLNLTISMAAVQFTGNLTLNNLAGTQKVTVTGNTNLALGDAVGDTITADEIDAGAFTGALTILGTPQIAIAIKGGAGNDTLLGSTSGDDLRGGDGNDRLTGQDGTDVLAGGGGADDFVFGSRTSTGDVIADFDPGSPDTAIDLLTFDLDDSSESNAWDDDTLTNAIAKCQGATRDPIAAVIGTPAVQRITSDATTANTGVSLFIMDDGVEYTAATLQTALQAAGNRTITTGSDGTVAQVNFLVVYDKGSSLGAGVIRNAANATTTDGCTVTEIMSLSNISSLSDIDATDFAYE